MTETKNVIPASPDPGSRIFVAGHRGLAGSAILRRLETLNYVNLITRTRAELDLRKGEDVDAFFAEQKPEFVYLAAATVGGIMANDLRRGDFIRDNLLIQVNVIDAARRTQAAVSRVDMHIPPRCAAADEGRLYSNRTARADELRLCGRQDCRA